MIQDHFQILFYCFSQIYFSFVLIQNNYNYQYDVLIIFFHQRIWPSIRYPPELFKEKLIEAKTLSIIFSSVNQQQYIFCGCQYFIDLSYQNITQIKKRHTTIFNPPAQVEKLQLTEKSQEIKQSILQVLKELPLTRSLTSQIHQQLVSIFKREIFKQGSVIIKQGDNGDRFYILVQGQADVYISDEKILTYTAPSGFGDLALLYSCQRQASIYAITDCVCYSLLKSQYNSYLIQSREKTIEKYKQFIKQVPCFQNLDEDKIFYLAQSMKPYWCEENKIIIKQGEIGDKMYFIEYGSVEIYKNDKFIVQINSGSYFGEAALFHNIPRNATIKSVTKCQFAIVDKETMINIIGDLDINKIEEGRN